MPPSQNREFEEKLKEHELLKRQLDDMNLDDNADEGSDQGGELYTRTKDRFLMENEGNNILGDGSDMEHGKGFRKNSYSMTKIKKKVM